MDELNRYEDMFDEFDDARELQYRDRQRAIGFRRARVERKALEKARKEAK